VLQPPLVEILGSAQTDFKPEMTQSEIHRMFQIAQVHGGGFIRKLATAGLVADPDNVGKILRTWPELQGMYGPGSIHWDREDV
jgi:hypothetical protein